MIVEEVIVAACFALVAWTYGGYPLVLGLFGRKGRNQSASEPETWPALSIILPFHNERNWIRRKIENTLALDYPSERVEIIAVSDGSTDGTNEALEEFRERIRVVTYSPRQGKPTALNRGVEASTGDLLVFSDANVLLDSNALRAVARNFTDPGVGGVCGNVALVGDETQEPLGEGIYMAYERWLYAVDSRFATMVGLDGACFAIRRDSFRALPPDTITDDFVIALNTIADGRQIFYDPTVRAEERVIPDAKAEYQRKVRMIAGGYQALWHHRSLLNPFAGPRVALLLASHKLLRWMVPIFIVVAVVASLTGSFRSPLLCWALALEVFLCGFAGLGALCARARRWKAIYIPYYFAVVNLAALAGLSRFVRGRQPITWEKVAR